MMGCLTTIERELGVFSRLEATGKCLFFNRCWLFVSFVVLLVPVWLYIRLTFELIDIFTLEFVFQPDIIQLSICLLFRTVSAAPFTVIVRICVILSPLHCAAFWIACTSYFISFCLGHYRYSHVTLPTLAFKVFSLFTLPIIYGIKYWFVSHQKSEEFYSTKDFFTLHYI